MIWAILIFVFVMGCAIKAANRQRTASVHYNKTYAITIALGIDILFASWIWRDYDITISAFTGLELRRGKDAARWAKILGAFLNWLEANHCELAIQGDRARAADALKVLGG